MAQIADLISRNSPCCKQICKCIESGVLHVADNGKGWLSVSSTVIFAISKHAPSVSIRIATKEVVTIRCFSIVIRDTNQKKADVSVLQSIGLARNNHGCIPSRVHPLVSANELPCGLTATVLIIGRGNSVSDRKSNTIIIGSDVFENLSSKHEGISKWSLKKLVGHEDRWKKNANSHNKYNKLGYQD